MKKALHSGGAETLNIYTGTLGLSLLGLAYLPWDFDAGLPRYLDGVVLKYRSLPGGELVPSSEGDTATHEVGHWHGLHHTFQNGCTAYGDTAYEASPACQCLVGRDTCADLPGLDPIHDFMDYMYDDCMRMFTTGQQSGAAFEAHHGARRCTALAGFYMQFVQRLANLRVSSSGPFGPAVGREDSVSGCGYVVGLATRCW